LRALLPQGTPDWQSGGLNEQLGNAGNDHRPLADVPVHRTEREKEMSEPVAFFRIYHRTGNETRLSLYKDNRLVPPRWSYAKNGTAISVTPKNNQTQEEAVKADFLAACRNAIAFR